MSPGTSAEVALFFDIGGILVGVSGGWMADAREAIATLRNRGVRLGIISNTGALSRAEIAAQLPSDFDFGDFDGSLVLLSSEVGFEKPHPRIFELALERAGAGTAVLFCTEDLDHCLAAQRAGMLALRVTPAPTSDIGPLVAVLRRARILADP